MTPSTARGPALREHRACSTPGSRRLSRSGWPRRYPPPRRSRPAPRRRHDRRPRSGACSAVWQHRPTWRPWRTCVDRAWDRGRVVRAGAASPGSAPRAGRSLQCAVAAGVAWLIAADLLGPPDAVLRAGRGRGLPRHVLRPAAAPGRRGDRRRRRRGASSPTCWRSGSARAGGSSRWSSALSMTSALLLDGGQLLVTQAAVQSIIVAALVPGAGRGIGPGDRCGDRGLRRAGRRHRGARRAAAPTARTGGGRDAQDRGAAARRPAR